MEELARRPSHEQREKSKACTKPSVAFRRYFEPKRGVELASPGFGYQGLAFAWLLVCKLLDMAQSIGETPLFSNFSVQHPVD